MSLPYMKFYPRDWRGDQALRAVSIAARGLWIECLCIMHEAKPYGHLMLNGDPVGDDALARMAGVPVDEVHQLLLELRQAGVLSVTRKGVVFSRRMTKDHARAQKGKTAVEKRWKQQESTGSQASDTKQKSDAPNRYPNRNPITQKPEARSQKDNISPIGDTGELDKAVSAYNAAATRCGWAIVQRMTKPRAASLKARLKEAGGLSGWEAAIEKAEASDFLCGRKPGRDGPFFASFDFITQPSSFNRLMEGNYDNRQQSGPSRAKSAADDPALRAIAIAAGMH